VTTPPRAPDASMTLITSMLKRPLDPGYQQAAERRQGAGLPPATSTRTVVVVVLAILIGFMFAVSAKALRPQPTAAAEARAELIERIEALQAHSTSQDALLTSLTNEIRGYEEIALKQAGAGDLTAKIKEYEIAAAVAPLKGPGLTMTLDDAAGTDANANAGNRPTSGFDSSRVTSADLQIVVNGLWGSGAEAIAINGHRLTSTGAIRFAGQAIIVDFRPLARPYVITALGDPAQLQRRFQPSFAGVYLSELAKQFGIRSSTAASTSLAVPGDSSTRLDAAQPVPSEVAPSRATSGATTP
jgi:uncharacterized protein YlxW (UPF0749 family)